MTTIPLRLGLQQRVMPGYRVAFFDTLAAACTGGLGVFYGQPRAEESIETADELQLAVPAHAKNVHIFRGRGYFCLQPNFIPWLEKWQPEALIVEANTRYLSTPAAVEWMHHQQRPVIGWGLGAPDTNAIESTLRSRFLHSLDAVIAYSRTGADQYVATGTPPERVFIAPNAVTFKPQAPIPQRPANFNAGKPCLLFVGRLQERKRIDLLLEACAALQQDFAPRLIIIGEGPERFRLEQLADQLYPDTEFVGAKYGLELEPYYLAADLFVLPGTGGLAVQQAMTHALPVIVGVADGTQGELVRSDNGWLLNETSGTELEQTLRQALSDIPRLRRMGLESHRIVTEEVNIEHMVDVFAKAVQFAAAHPRKGI
jgi:glycosyltransferase involved in cell wall biosynthesis